jgi:hypothetical protein
MAGYPDGSITGGLAGAGGPDLPLRPAPDPAPGPDTEPGPDPEAGPDTEPGTPDTGIADTGAPETGISDSGTPETGAPDTGTPDTGIPETGAADTGTDDRREAAAEPLGPSAFFRSTFPLMTLSALLMRPRLPLCAAK